MYNDVAPETPDFGPEHVPPEPDLTEADLDSEDELEEIDVPVVGEDNE